MMTTMMMMMISVFSLFTASLSDTVVAQLSFAAAAVFSLQPHCPRPAATRRRQCFLADCDSNALWVQRRTVCIPTWVQRGRCAHRQTFELGSVSTVVLPTIRFFPFVSITRRKSAVNPFFEYLSFPAPARIDEYSLLSLQSCLQAWAKPKRHFFSQPPHCLCLYVSRSLRLSRARPHISHPRSMTNNRSRATPHCHLFSVREGGWAPSQHAALVKHC
jgi:hypothetical protein